MRPALSATMVPEWRSTMRVFIAAFIGAFIANRVYHMVRKVR